MKKKVNDTDRHRRQTLVLPDCISFTTLVVELKRKQIKNKIVRNDKKIKLLGCPHLNKHMKITIFNSKRLLRG